MATFGQNKHVNEQTRKDESEEDEEHQEPKVRGLGSAELMEVEKIVGSSGEGHEIGVHMNPWREECD